jgi:hypothetical protein
MPTTSTSEKQTAVAVPTVPKQPINTVKEGHDDPPLRQHIQDIRQPVAQFVINSLLQVAAFATAIAFGVFAVKSVDVQDLANNYASQATLEALTANQLTLLSFCLSVIAGSQGSR